MLIIKWDADNQKNLKTTTSQLLTCPQDLPGVPKLNEI